ncbi:MAG: chemotaxis protein CheW [Sulfobacillus sp.]
MAKDQTPRTRKRQSTTPFFRLVEVWIEDQRYGLALERVEQVLPMVWVAPLPEAPEIVIGVINVRGSALPVLDIRKRLGLPTRAWDLTAKLVVVQLQHGRIAVPVDEVVGVRDQSRADMDAVLPLPLPQSGDRRIPGIVGLADGLLFLCDLEAFLSLDEQHQLTAALDRGAR